MIGYIVLLGVIVVVVSWNFATLIQKGDQKHDDLEK